MAAARELAQTAAVGGVEALEVAPCEQQGLRDRKHLEVRQLPQGSEHGLGLPKHTGR